MFDGTTSQLLLVLVLPVVAGLLCLFVTEVREVMQTKNHLDEKLVLTASIPSNPVGVFSLADAYDCDHRVLWEIHVPALQLFESGITFPELCRLWQRYAGLYPELYEGTSAGDWLKFLQDCNLVENGDNLVRLTADGRDFVNFLIRSVNSSRSKVVAK